MELLSRALRKIEAEAQRSGLTDRVYNFLKNERSKQKESKPAKFFKSGKEEVKLPKEDHSEEIYRKINVLLDPKN